MKKTLAILSALAIAATPAVFAADTVVSTTTGGATTTTATTMGTGTVTTFTPGSALVIKTEKEPMTYQLGSDVTYVNSTGAVVEASMIKAGVPVQVHYVERDGAMVADRVIVEESTTTTTTTVEE